MGIEKDYLMRQLMMLFEVIHKMLRHRKKGESEEAEKSIQYFYECLKIEDDLEQLSVEQLIDLLEGEKNLTKEQIELVAFVLKEQGELQSDESRRVKFFQKAYFLLQNVDRESPLFSLDRQMKMEELKTYLN
jgi:DNA polymerase IIIc chi subunit